MFMEFLYWMEVLIIQINHISPKRRQNQVCKWPLHKTPAVKTLMFPIFKFTPKPIDSPNGDDPNQAYSYITESKMMIQ